MKLSKAIASYRRGQQGKLLQILLMIAVIAVCGYMIADQWDDIQYEISDQKIVDLGRAEGSDPGATVGAQDLYVRITGITSSRGAVVKAGRLGALFRGDRWYRQLVGAPVFLEIEVGQDESLKERFSVFTEVKAEGRGRLLHSSSDYEGIVNFFRKTYGYEIPAGAVVITVDHTPGGTHRALVTSALLGLIALINVGLFVFLILRRPSVAADIPA